MSCGFRPPQQWRESNEVPRFLLEHVGNQVILMQTLHNNDDVSALFIIQPAIERVVIPFVACIALGFRERFVRLQRIVNDGETRSASGQHLLQKSRAEIRFGLSEIPVQIAFEG